MNRTFTTISGIGLGAGLMYFLDRDRGKRRRALARDQLASAMAQSRHAVGKVSRDLSNRTRGVASEARGLLWGDRHPDDDVLVARVRSRIGRVVSHPGAIQVEANNGRVSLKGPVLTAEIDSLLKAVQTVHGVREVDDQLDSHTEADIPALQGGSAHHRELTQESWTPALRMFVGAAGGAMAVYGLTRNNGLGMVSSLVGAGMLARAGANCRLSRLVSSDHGGPGVEVQKTIHIQAPVEEVYSFWANYRNFPKFMRHLREVHDLGNGKSHWVAEGPAGAPIEWQAEITEQVPNKLLAWKSLPGSQVENSGTVRFDANGDSGTRIQIRMSYHPPAGALGHVVASLFGADPRHEMDEDLIRMKSLFEAGRTRARDGHVIEREQLVSTARRF